MVDDFGVKYFDKADANHLDVMVAARHPIKCNWDPDFYLDMTMEWSYNNRTVTLSMSGYIKEALLRF